ncbi:type 1 secretion C-terminal target domain (VC_A0849 subclass) [Enterobacteriaceae bacterium strain FGI 57]|nr:type 1 secretion C-terminal target domain (VC_A0849 subclass) [Enterobacteriaceae bacterium strain FGI 57]
MSTVIGTIKAIIGQAWIVASDGTRRQATEGEQVMRGEQIVTEQGAVTVTLPNGKNLDLGRASHWGDDTTVTTSTESSTPQDLAAAQQAIAEGADPSQVLEATAAGNPVTSSATGEAGDGGEGHTHVVLDLTGQILDPTAGYPTEGIDVTFPGPLEEVTLLETDQDVNDTDDDPIITPEPPVPPVLPEASITIDVIAGDNIINMREAMQETTAVSGKTGHDVRPGDVVTVTVNGHHYQTTVQADGSWSVNVNTSDLLASGDVQASVTTRDDNGNEATASAQSSVGQATLSVEVDIDPVGGDGWINAEEAKAENTVISGTVGGDAKAGDVVHLEVNGNQYEAVVREDLTWSTEVKTSDLLADPEVNGSITIKDEAGNEASATAVEPVKVDTDISVTLDIDVIAGDGWINAEEAKAENTVISGTVGGDAKAGDTVHLEVNGNQYEAVVREDLTWSTEVKTADLLADPEVNGSITIRDEAGNEATATAVEPVQVDTTLPTVTLDIDVIAGDGWINAEEAKAENTTISGTVGGDAKAGDTVVLEVNGNRYEAEVQADLTWSTEVKTADLLADPEVNGTITIRDEAGNEATATAVEPVQVDTTLPTVTLDIDVIAGDGWINAEEAKAENTTISGTVGGDAKAGDTVVLEVNGNRYEAEVQADLTWSTEVKTSDLLADPEVNGTITIKDEAGNEATATAVEPVQVDTTLPTVTLDIDVIAGDGWINAEEAKAENTTITGTVGGDAKAGDTVVLEVNGNRYEAEVQADLTWSTEVKTSDLLADPEVNGTITIKDEAGNEATATAVEPVQVDTTLPTVTLDIDVIAGDGWINTEEAKAENTTISGIVGGDAKAGDTVVLEVNGNRYEAEVQADLTWSTEVKTADLLADPEVNGTITIKDEAGNEATATAVEPVQVDTTLPTVTLDIDVIAGDGWINAEEAKAENTIISGIVGGDAKAGDTVVLEVNGNRYEAEVQADLTWSTEVKTSDLLADPEVNGTITIKDEAGNEATATAVEPVQVDTTLPTVTLDIDVIAGDGWINAEEAKAENTTISGIVGGDAKAGDTVVLEVNGNRYEAVVREDLTWSTEVKTADLLADNTVDGTITIRDEAGNEATARDNELVKIDTTINVVVTIDPITGDDFLSFSETNKLPGQDSPTIKVTGTVTGEATTDDFVTVQVGDTVVKVPVQEDGEGNLFWEAEFTADNLMKNPEVSASITVQDEAGNVASSAAERPVTIETGNVITGNEYDNVLQGGDGTSDVIIADTQGFQQEPGQNYNIAFVVDSSGSVGSTDVKAIIKSLTEVFNTLSNNAKQEGAGEVKILLIDFDTQVNYAVSVNLSDPNALKTLTDALAKMTSGGGTNYEDAFKTAANWFHEVGSENSENLTYFITDGKPTYYQGNERTSVDVDGRSGANNVVTLDMSKIDYQEGQIVTMNINGTNRTVIDANGNVYSWNGNSGTNIGVVRADGKGGYEISTRGGTGNSTNSTTTSNSLTAFALLMAACSNVEAIGINNGIGANDLKSYDSDGNVMSGIAADELANAILGGDNVQMAGAQDTVHGNAGNDILFGDMVLFGSSNGYAAIKEYVAGKLGVSANDLDVSHVSQYINEHPAEFDQSQNDGGKDVLFGGQGDDILYGGGGDDILVGGSGDDVLFGGKGDDILIGDGFDSSAELASHMGTTVGELTFDKVADYVVQNSDELGAMGSGNDILHGGEGDDILLGGGGNDILNGGLGGDILYGGTGNDILTGGKGDDILHGGTGSDTFTWLKGDDGHDVIKDFNVAEGDRIDLSELLGEHVDNLDNFLQVTQDNSGNAVIEINTNGQIASGANMSITVEGCSAADINSLLANPDNTSIII